MTWRLAGESRQDPTRCLLRVLTQRAMLAVPEYSRPK
jgi:hypothetical protein